MARLKTVRGRLSSPAPKLRLPPKQAEGFYQSKAWRSLVAMRKRDPDYAAALRRCKPGERVILDHERERKDGGADLDPANTAWLTNSEHQAKTAQARGRRALGETR